MFIDWSKIAKIKTKKLVLQNWLDVSFFPSEAIELIIKGLEVPEENLYRYLWGEVLLSFPQLQILRINLLYEVSSVYCAILLLF